MYCKSCGAKLSEDALFCLNCGEPTTEEKTEVVIEGEYADKPTENKVWGIFARIGYWMGIGSLIANIFIGIGAAFAVYGIVFSALGKRSEIYKDKAKSGLVMNIIAAAVGIVILSVFYILYIMLVLYAIGE